MTSPIGHAILERMLNHVVFRVKTQIVDLVHFLVQAITHAFQDSLVFGILGEVLDFMRIGIQVEELFRRFLSEES